MPLLPEASAIFASVGPVNSMDELRVMLALVRGYPVGGGQGETKGAADDASQRSDEDLPLLRGDD